MNDVRRAGCEGWTRVGAVIALMLLGGISSILAAEVIVRIAHIGSDQLLRPDQTLGVRFMASRRGLSQGPCFDTTVSINSHGWRGRDVSFAKPANTYRVLVLGDSFMAALQVHDDETFARVLERELNANARSQRVEVVNFGVPSWGTDQEYLSLQEEGFRYEPDLVLLAFYAMNDVSDNSAAFVPDPARDLKPFFDIVDGKLVQLPFRPPYPWPLVAGFQLAADFRLYPVVRNTLLRSRGLHQRLYDVGLVAMPPAIARPDELRRSTWGWPPRWIEQREVYRVQDDEQWTHAWAITEQLVAATKNDVTARGIDFLLIDIGPPLAVMPSSILAGIDGGPTDLDLDKPTRRLADLAGRHGIDFLSLVPLFRSEIGDSKTAFARYFLPCDGHWTAAGHRLAARAVAAEVARRVR